MIPLELLIGLIVVVVLVLGGWAILRVLVVTFAPETDTIDEVAQEREFLEGVQRAARR